MRGWGLGRGRKAVAEAHPPLRLLRHCPFPRMSRGFGTRRGVRTCFGVRTASPRRKLVTQQQLPLVLLPIQASGQQRVFSSLVNLSRGRG